ncbi:MAG: aldehyde ferredoxin oxidoreductase family protein [Chloroflexota bacterium]
MRGLGRVLSVDLSSGRVEASEYSLDLARLLLAGRGASSHYLCQLVTPQTDPLGAENPLLFCAGLLTGTAAPASSRLHVGARSPLTGLLGSSNVGAHFGAALRAAGWQALLLRGESARPVYLAIDGAEVALRPATDLWGLDTWQTQSRLAALPGLSGARVMAIGPAGEQKVRFACVMTERGHAAGRTGMGAVMGAKRLKAIAVGGHGASPPTDEGSREAVRAYARAIREAPRYATYSQYSNGAYLIWADEQGILGTQNFSRNRFADAASIDGKRLHDYVTKPQTCHRCPVHCKAEISVPRGKYALPVGERPDIEPIMALGARCGVGDPEAVLYLYNLCGQLGLDAISAGASLAFATDLYERGIITDKTTGGLALRWGDGEALAALLRQIATRQGLGEVLAEGVARAAELIGQGAGELAFHSKGLELTGYDPRGGMGTALGYAVSARGGDFSSTYPVPEYRWDAQQGERELGCGASVDRTSTTGKGRLLRRTMSVAAALDALGLCKVPALSVLGDFSLRAEAALATELLGEPFSAAELMRVGERIINLERLLNLRLGAVAADDTLPARFTKTGLSDEPGRGRMVDLEPMVHEFYNEMGWDQSGHPKPATLHQLGLEEYDQC